MNAPFALDCYRPAVEDITRTVFETMLGMEIQPIEANGQLSEITAAVYYAGEWKGALLLHCSEEQAKDWSCRLMSLEPPVSRDDARDGLGEVANMLAGNLKPLLPPGVGLSLPSVVDGSDHTLRLCGNNQSENMAFHDGRACFGITFVVIPEKEPMRN